MISNKAPYSFFSTAPRSRKYVIAASRPFLKNCVLPEVRFLASCWKMVEAPRLNEGIGGSRRRVVIGLRILFFFGAFSFLRFCHAGRWLPIESSCSKNARSHREKASCNAANLLGLRQTYICAVPARRFARVEMRIRSSRWSSGFPVAVRDVRKGKKMHTQPNDDAQTRIKIKLVNTTTQFGLPILDFGIARLAFMLLFSYDNLYDMSDWTGYPKSKIF